MEAPLSTAPDRRVARLPRLEDLGLVPGQQLLVGLSGRVDRQMDLPAVELVVHAAVRILVAKAATDRKAQVWSDCDVAEVEQAMQVAAQRNPVRDLVRAAGCPWADVSGFDYRQ